MAGIIFYAGAKAHFLHHLQIVFRAHFKALGLQQLAMLLKPGDPLAQFLANRQQRWPQFLRRRHELFARINGHCRKRFDFFPGQRLKPCNLFNLIAKKFHPQGIFPPRRANLDRIAPHAKLAARKFNIVARILQIDQPVKKMVARHFPTGTNGDHHRLVIFLAADAIDA